MARALFAEVGRNPYDKALSDLIGELSTRGDTFRQRWARHEVRRHLAGAKRLNLSTLHNQLERHG